MLTEYVHKYANLNARIVRMDPKWRHTDVRFIPQCRRDWIAIVFR